MIHRFVCRNLGSTHPCREPVDLRGLLNVIGSARYAGFAGAFTLR